MEYTSIKPKYELSRVESASTVNASTELHGWKYASTENASTSLPGWKAKYGSGKSDLDTDMTEKYHCQSTE